MHTTLPTIIFIPGIFFQVWDINHFALIKDIVGCGHGDWVVERAVSTGGEATAAVKCNVCACWAVVRIAEEGDFPVCLDLAGYCWRWCWEEEGSQGEGAWFHFEFGLRGSRCNLRCRTWNWVWFEWRSVNTAMKRDWEVQRNIVRCFCDEAAMTAALYLINLSFIEVSGFIPWASSHSD